MVNEVYTLDHPTEELVLIVINSYSEGNNEMRNVFTLD